ncbi:MAG: hypothetical protein RLZZ214_2081 [Verrucomicrobiota bacterium]
MFPAAGQAGLTISIVEFDSETRFRAIAARDSVEKGLAVLDHREAAFVSKSSPSQSAEDEYAIVTEKQLFQLKVESTP